MAINPEGYFNSLKDYLNDHYQVGKRDNGRIVLEEKVYWADDSTPKKQKVRLPFKGDVIVVKLDSASSKDPLFHFFTNKSRPWAKRCDFVIFQRIRTCINIYCIEFKSGSLPDSLLEQLNASEAWCRSVHAIIHAYTGKKRRLNLRKYVFSSMVDPSSYLDDQNYLQRDHSVRHFHYDDLKTISLDELTNTNVEYIG